MSSSSTPPIPAWYFLVLGVSLGFNFATSERAISEFFGAWQSVVNTVLVPLYSLCVCLYLASLVSESTYQQYFVRRKQKSALLKEDITDGLLPPGEQAPEGVVDMNGSFRLTKTENFDDFLAVQGVPWAARRAVTKARPTHTFVHRGNTVQIRIEGVWSSSTTYQINGPPQECNIRGRVFRDLVTYLETGDGIETHKKAVTEDYDIIVTRKLSEDRKNLTMTSRAVFSDDRPPIQSVQYFERVQ